MVFLRFLIFLLALGYRVKAEENTLELGSGELEIQTTTAPMIYLIDDNGDIPTSFRNLTDLQENVTSEAVIDLATEEVDFRDEEKKGNESTTLMTSTTADGEMTENPSTMSNNTTIAVTTEAVTTMNKTEVSTTEITTENDWTTTTAESTVTSTTSTTKVPTTAFDETSTVTMKETTSSSTKQPTTLSSTTTGTGKSDKSTGHNPKQPANEDKNSCVFLNPDFECSMEVICFGEGEIDCETEDNQFIMDKIAFSSSTSEDDIEYEVSESGTIGTFPPNLVGVGTPKKIPFYNMQSFTTTDGVTEETSEAVETTSINMGKTTETISVNPPSEVGKASETMKNNCSNDMGENSEAGNNCSTGTTATTESTSTMGSTEKAMDVETVSEATESTANVESTYTAHETTFESTSMKILFSKLGTTTSYDTDSETTTVPLSTQDSFDEKKEKSEDPVNKTEKARRKRGFFSANSDLTPEAQEKLGVEYLQRKYLINPTCRLSGDIQCLPVPTTATCRGKTFCQAKLRKSETAASSKAKGLEIWMIVVIVICGFFGFMTVGMITYLVIHSCKKLKVQPTHDVTPLNYITKKAENTETA